jgi:hypothetical protein
VVDSLGKGLPVRRGDRLVFVEPGSVSYEFDFGLGPQRCTGIAGTDLSIAWRSTGIPNVEIYFHSVRDGAKMFKADRHLGKILKYPQMHRLLERYLQTLPEGPTQEQLDRASAVIVAEVEQADGSLVRSRLELDNASLTPMEVLW